MSKLMALVYLLYSVGCGFSIEPRRVYLDRASVPSDLDADTVSEQLREAAAFWQDCGYDIEIGEGESVQFADELPTAAALASTDPGHGVTLRAGALWVMGETCREGYYLGDALRHELGHVVGLGHDPEPTSVMYGRVTECTDRYVADACPRP